MKKVVITTFFKAENYGAVLQAYALQKILHEKGYDTEILNYRDSAIEDEYKIFNFKNGSMYSKMRSLFKSILFLRKRKKRHDHFRDFQQHYLRIGDKGYRSVEEIKKDPPRADIYVTGSDQVWNTSITKGVSDIYTLNFGLEKVRRIAYAASIGTAEICQNEGEEFREKVSGIDAISVREITAKNALARIFLDKPVEVTLDPVLLRSKRDWEADLSEITERKEKYILAYLVAEDQEYRKIVNAMSENTGLKIIHFESRSRYNNVLSSAYTEGPMDFVNLIKNAEYIVTTSFHGTAFSIVLHKKFWVIPHKPKGSRITDLLDKLQLSERAVYTLEEFTAKDFDQKIDYEKVDNLLDKEREKSLQWLGAAMEGNDLYA